MAISVKHKFQSAKADSADASIVRPSNWNDEHDLLMATARLLGRTAAGNGPVQEISLGNTLQFTGTTLEASALLATKAQLDALAATVADPWALMPIGVPLIGSMAVSGSGYPPTNNPNYRYALLTAGRRGAGDYNNGIFSSEGISGSWPAISASAVISLAGSPLNGATIQLINTMRTFLRPGSPGTHQYFAVQSHNHGVNDPGHAHGGVQNGTSSTGRSTAVDQPPAVYSFGGTWAAATGIWLSNAGDEETRPRNFGVDYVMRIK